MSRDNWGRLVAAVVRSEQLWQLFHQQSRSPSPISSDDSTGENPNLEHLSPSPSSLANWFISQGVPSPQGKVGCEWDERIPLSTDKVHSLDCEPSHDILSHPKYLASLVFSHEVYGISILRSIYIVLIKAKISVLLPFGTLAIVLQYFTSEQEWAFFCSLIGIIPIVERLGYATEQLTIYTGPTVGRLLYVGSATEMMISMHALNNGMMTVVKQCLVGSILSNMLLVLGCAFFCGEMVHRRHQNVQKFNKATARVNSGLLLMAVMCLLFPTVLHLTHTEVHQGKSEISLSRFSSCLMLLAYATSLVFQLKSQSNLYRSLNEAMENSEGDTDEDEVPEITHWEAIGWLALLTLWLSVLSGYLVDTIQGASDSTSIPVAFISVILVPVVVNAARHARDIMSAKLDVTVGVAIGISSQISMFVIPFSVMCGWILGKPMDLNFQPLEAATLFITVLVVPVMLQGGQSNYSTGLMFILCYLIVAAAFFLHIHPSSNDDD